MEYLSKDCKMKGSAWVAVRHWDGYGAPAQVFEVGAMDSSCEAARLDRGRFWCFAGTARALEESIGATARPEKVDRSRIFLAGVDKSEDLEVDVAERFEGDRKEVEMSPRKVTRARNRRC